MDAAGPIPSPSAAWSRLASTGDSLSDSISGTSSSTPIRREDDAAQLKARLLRMIVTNEHSRKSASEASKSR